MFGTISRMVVVVVALAGAPRGADGGTGWAGGSDTEIIRVLRRSDDTRICFSPLYAQDGLVIWVDRIEKGDPARSAATLQDVLPQVAYLGIGSYYRGWRAVDDAAVARIKRFLVAMRFEDDGSCWLNEFSGKTILQGDVFEQVAKAKKIGCAEALGQLRAAGASSSAMSIFEDYLEEKPDGGATSTHLSQLK